MLVQLASAWQLWTPDSHSSMSENKGTTNALDIFWSFLCVFILLSNTQRITAILNPSRSLGTHAGPFPLNPAVKVKGKKNIVKYCALIKRHAKTC